MELIEILLAIAALLVGLAFINVLLGTDILFGWTVQSLARMATTRLPNMARRLGFGSEVSEPLASNNGSTALVGRTGEIERAIENGHGRARVGGVSWPAEGEDMGAGTCVRVVSVDGDRLIVQQTTTREM